MRWGHANAGQDRVVLTSSSGTAGPGQGADVLCSTVPELREAVAAGAHPTWSGHPDLRPVVGDGVQVSTVGLSRITAVGNARVWAHERSGVQAHDEVVVTASGHSTVTCSGSVRVDARGWADVVVASQLGFTHLGTGQTVAATDVRVQLSEGACLGGAPQHTRVRAAGTSHVVIDGLYADVDIELLDWATCTIATAKDGRVDVLARDHAMVEASGGAVTLTGSTRLMVQDAFDDEHVTVHIQDADDVAVAAPQALLSRVGRDLAGVSGVPLLDVAVLDQVPQWLRFHHRDPDTLSPPGLLRVFVLTSAKPGHQGGALGGTHPRTLLLPGSTVPVGVRLEMAGVWPLAVHLSTPAQVVAIDIPPQDWRPKRSMGYGWVQTSAPCAVHAADPFASPADLLRPGSTP